MLGWEELSPISLAARSRTQRGPFATPESSPEARVRRIQCSSLSFHGATCLQFSRNSAHEKMN